LLWDKRRILEVYLNVVEWGDGVFGAEAAANRYFGNSASQLSAAQAARLAVMLPAPRRFEKNPNSEYLNRRTQLILNRMHYSAVP
jgi:monofunctional biosynthetic peptidoglycan transglycosylase